MDTSSSTKATQPDKPTLTDLLRTNTRWFIDPIVTFLARFHLSPDALTIAGMLSHFLFAWLIATGQLRWAGVAIFFITPLDALDGALARKLGRKQGGFGAFLDSTLDRLAEIVLFAGFLIYFSRQDNDLLVLATYVVLTGSIMVSYIRARAESLGLSCKVGLFSRVERYGVIVLALLLNLPAYGILILAVGSYFTTVQRIYHVWRQYR